MTLMTVSPSRLTAFSDCPYRYFLRYVAPQRRPAKPRPAHQSLGDSIHMALALWWDLPPARRSFGEAGNLLNEHWIDSGYRDADQSRRWRDRARGWVRSYVTGLVGTPPPRGVERTVSATDGQLVLTGRVDRLDDRNGQLVVVDYKAGRESPTERDARGSLALAMYVVATGRMLRRRCARAELHHIPTRTVVAVDYDADTVGRQLARVHAVAADIRAATDTWEAGASPDRVFPAQPGGLCRSCEHRPDCPTGQLFGPAAEPWAVLDRWEAALSGAVA